MYIYLLFGRAPREVPERDECGAKRIAAIYERRAGGVLSAWTGLRMIVLY